MKTWQDTAVVVVSKVGTRAELLEGKGAERVLLRFPATCPKLTGAELEKADALMAEWDAKQTSRAA